MALIVTGSSDDQRYVHDSTTRRVARWAGRSAAPVARAVASTCRDLRGRVGGPLTRLRDTVLASHGVTWLFARRVHTARAAVVIALAMTIAVSSVGLVRSDAVRLVAEEQASEQATAEAARLAEVAAAREAAAASAQVAIDKAEAVRASAARAAVPPETLAALDEASAQVQDLVEQVRAAPVVAETADTEPVETAAPAVRAAREPVDLPVTTPQTLPDPVADAAVILDVVPTVIDEVKQALPEVTVDDDPLSELLAAVDQLAESTAEVTAAAEANRVAAELEEAYEQAVADAQAAHAAALAAASQTRAARMRADAHSLDGYSNGQIPASAMCAPAFNLNVRLRCDAAEMLDALNQSYRARFGHDLAISDSYRSLAGQIACRETKGSLCANPGTSKHGVGLAVDLSGPAARLGTVEHQWMLDHVKEHGWLKPSWSLPTGSKPEPWHFEFTGAP